MSMVCKLDHLEQPTTLDEPIGVSTGNGVATTRTTGQMPGVALPALLLPKLKFSILSFGQCIKYGFSFDYIPLRNHFVLKSGEGKQLAHFKPDEYGWYIPFSVLRNLRKQNHVAYSSAAGNALREGFSRKELDRAEEVVQLHKALGHIPYPDLTVLLDGGHLHDCHLTSKDVKVALTVFPKCQACLRGKSTKRRTTPRIEREIPRAVGEHLHVDVIFFGKRPYLMSVDGYSGHLKGNKISSRKFKEIKRAIFLILEYYKKHGHQAAHDATIHSDREAAIVQLGDEHLVKVQLTGPDQHERLLESWAHILRPRMRATLAGLPYKLPQSLYIDCFEDLLRRLNDQVNSRSAPSTPQEKVVGTKPSYKETSSNGFGTMGIFNEPNVDSNTAPTAEVGIIVGYEPATPSNKRVYFPATKTFATRKKLEPYICESTVNILNKQAEEEHKQGLSSWKPSDTNIDVHSLAYKSPENDNVFTEPEEAIEQLDPYLETTSANVSPPLQPHDEVNPESVQQSHEGVGAYEAEAPESPEIHTSTENANTTDNRSPEPIPATRGEPPRYFTRKSKHLFASSINKSDYIPVIEDIVNFYMDVSNMSIKEAMETLNEDMVKTSIKTEFQNMIKYQTWKEIYASQLTPIEAKNIIPSKIFLKLKFHANGLVDKLKARLVGGGHRQKEETYGRTAAPTVAPTHVLLAMQLAAQLDMYVGTVDIPAAYLNANLNERVHMRLSKEITKIYVELYPEAAKFVDPKTQTLVVQLLKALYGLKQAALQWNEALTTLLKRHGFKSVSTDKCFMFKGEGENLIMILIHVDDLLVISKLLRDMQKLEQLLSSQFGEVKINTENPTYLGMIIKKELDGSFVLSQPGYASQICEKFNVLKPAKSPSTENFFTSQDDPSKNYFSAASKFQSQLMSAGYLAFHTRPDILKEIVFLASVSQNPGPIAQQKLDRVYSFIMGTIDKGIRFSKSDKFQLHVYADAAFAVHRNGKSHSGVIVCMGENGGPIIAKSKMQSLVSLSSTEAELFALVVGIQSAGPIAAILKELNLLKDEIPVIVHQDNQSAITIALGGEGFGGKSRHMRVRYQFICELADSGDIKIVHCPTELMRADLLTKVMGGIKFQNQASNLLNEKQANI